MSEIKRTVTVSLSDHDLKLIELLQRYHVSIDGEASRSAIVRWALAVAADTLPESVDEMEVAL